MCTNFWGAVEAIAVVAEAVALVMIFRQDRKHNKKEAKRFEQSKAHEEKSALLSALSDLVTSVSQYQSFGGDAHNSDILGVQRRAYYRVRSLVNGDRLTALIPSAKQLPPIRDKRSEVIEKLYAWCDELADKH